MRLIAWIIRVMLFLAALGFALSYSGLTELRFFGVDVVWRAPLVIFLLAFFAAGTAMGLLGVVPMLFRQRREITRLRREIKTNARNLPATQPAPPDVPATGPIASGLPLR